MAPHACDLKQKALPIRVHAFNSAKSTFISMISFIQRGFTEHLVCGSIRSNTNASVLVPEAFMNHKKETCLCPAELYTHTNTHTGTHAYIHMHIRLCIHTEAWGSLKPVISTESTTIHIV